MHGAEKKFLGPMCFRDRDLPHVPPPPPSPPGFALLLGSSCLVSDGMTKTPITVSAQCVGAKKWHLVPQLDGAQHICASPYSPTYLWHELARRNMCRLLVGLAWEQDEAPVYVKVNETSGNACQRGLVYANPDEGSGLTN